MKVKLLSLFALAVLSLAIFTSLASALSISSSSLTFTNVDDIESLTITGDVGEVVSSLPTLISNGDVATLSYFSNLEATSPLVTPLTLTTGSTTIFVKANPGDNFALGGTGVIVDTTPTLLNASFSVNFNGNLDLKIEDFSVSNGFGPDDTEWYPLDEIKAQIYVDNKNPSGSDNKIKNIIVQWGLYDLTSEKFIVSGTETKFTLDGGDDKTINVDFKIDKLSKLKDAQGNDFEFYVWATGDDYYVANEPETSGSDSQSITLNLDDNFVVLNNLQIGETASCGGTVQVTADVVNIGADDQEDVYVVIYNKELGINQKVNIGNIDSMEDSPLDVAVTIPDDADEKTYSLLLSVYDEHDDIYQNDNDDQSEFSSTTTINSCSLVPLASVSANLESPARAGQELTIKATIVNMDSELSTFNLDLSDYSEWASLVNMDRNFVTLGAGESQDVFIKLKSNSDSAGEQKFNLNVKEGSKVLSQPILVTIKNGFSLSSITGFFSKVSGGNNLYLWGIGALNVLLILVIIFVAAKVVRKK